MGLSQSKRGPAAAPVAEEGVIFITYKGYRSWPSEGFSSKYDVFLFEIRYQRYFWTIDKRYSEFLTLEKKLNKLYPSKMNVLKRYRPEKFTKMFWTHDHTLLTKRGQTMLRYLQFMFKDEDLLYSHPMREFLEIGKTSFHPQLGRKGKEGWLQKSSGGYSTSNAGDFIKTWRRRWFVLHDTYFAYYASDTATEPLGFMQIDKKFEVDWKGRDLTVSNKVRKLKLYASSLREASNWFEAFNSFYKTSTRRRINEFQSSFPIRTNTSVRLYLCGKEYFMGLCMALLQAKEEIFIASWMVSPTQLLTRPPLPPLRLDQVLKYKAEQGVRVYILLYKEVEMSGTGNDSLKCKLHFEGLSPNIHVIRHPNKLLGSSTAILWSHHEKLVIIDRNLAFAGGIDPCFGRWDDTSHCLTDVDGVLYPGDDYYQPARGLFRPVYFPPDPNIALADEVVCVLDEPKPENELGVEEIFMKEENNGIVDRGSDISENVPSESSSLSEALSFYEEDMDLNLERSHSESIGNLTEKEVSAMRCQSEYESPINRLAVQQGGHMSPLVSVQGTPLVSATPLPLVHSTVQQPVSHQQPIFVQSTVVSAQQSTSLQFQHQQVSSDPTEQQGSLYHQQATQFKQIEQSRTYDVTSVVSTQQQAIVGHTMQQHNQDGTPLHNGVVPTAPPPTSSSLNQQSSVAYSSVYSSSNRRSTRSSQSNSIFSTSGRSISQMLSDSFASLATPDDTEENMSDKLSSWLKGFADAFEDKNVKIPDSQLRQQYPRMPWHDVHCCITGLPARDLGAHFVMRWNHHKKSKGSQDLRYLTDVTDNTSFGVCANCKKENIFETVESCPNCGHDLGPVNRSLNVTPAVDFMKPSTLHDDINKNNNQNDCLKGAEVNQNPSYVTFRCQFKTRMGCRIQGDGPVIITQITQPEVVRELPSTLISREGEDFKTDFLLEQGLYPMIGDIVTSVNGTSVLHLTTPQLQRFLYLSKRKREAKPMHRNSVSSVVTTDFDEQSVMSRQSTQSSNIGIRKRRNSSTSQAALTVCFRRYYVDDIEDVVKVDAYYKMLTDSMLRLKDKVKVFYLARRYQEQNGLLENADKTANSQIVTEDVADENIAVDENPKLHVEDINALSSTSPVDVVTIDSLCDEEIFDLGEEFDSNNDIPFGQACQDVLVKQGYLTKVEEERLTQASRVTGLSIAAIANESLNCREKNAGILPYNLDGTKAMPGICPMSQDELKARKEYMDMYISFVNYNYLETRRDLVCRVATSMEVNRMMSEFQSHTQNSTSYKDILPIPGAHSGTCHVQVLRSVGDWSIGQETEHSIQNAWIDAINNANHFIYIENQFFIGSLGGSSIKNGIAHAILNRILRAIQENKVFKVIIVVPLHPEGDFVHSSGPRGVLNFQYKTICRGKQSLLVQLQRRLQPFGRDPLEFISFNSLRTYGELEGRLITEQIYVHDKLIIVDDRVIIIGSANINDRSMCGDRDSEVALRIEDTRVIQARMNCAPWLVGSLPHSFRKRLMSTHMGDSSSDLTDPICHEVYHDLWLRTAKDNTEIYHELDGAASYEIAPTVKAFDQAINNKAFLYFDDPLVEAHICRLKGHLIFWPQNFLSKESMSFAGSANAVLPSDIFT